jgi:hypothetical protein
MSQQAAAGQGTGRGGGRKPRYFPRGRGVDHLTKAFKSMISEIAEHMFNTGENKYVVQFTRSREEVANYLQHTSAEEGYLVAEMVQTGKQQIIPLLPPVDPNAEDKADLEIIQAKDSKMIAKRQQKLQESLKKGYATVYGQCSQQVHNKLKSTENWVAQKEQSLHDLILEVEKICVGFDDHKQKVFNLVQALRALFLYTQNKKDMVEEYGRNFKSLWDTVKVFGGSPGVYKGVTDTILKAVVPAREVATAAQVKAAGIK